MRIQATALFFLASLSVAHAQCALGAYPTTNGNGMIVCQSAGGQTPPSSGFDPGGSATGPCPQGATPGVDSWGNRTCSSLTGRSGPLPPSGTAKVRKSKSKKFELSNKCPLCK